MAEKHNDQEFIEYVVKCIVNHPDDVKAERTVDERGVLITLHINQEDMGYVVGRQGQTARALRTLLKIVGAKDNARVNLKIFEPEGARREHQAARAAAAPIASAEAPKTEGEGLVTDEDLADLGI
ncbi:MAG: KH domain-containing protein [Patescibacteria group bacterium]|nr:KH domain-containing protein [Patescibacteria group bacterium]MBU2509510.1 KH domain-containing protein [Patescibacteria group bacterium]